MRIAILADIHGNLAAFEAALDHVKQQQVDRLVIAGDIVVGAPDSAACWRLAQSLNCWIVRGNHERYVAHFATPEADPQWQSDQYAPVHWVVDQLTEAERQAMIDLPLSISLPTTGPDLRIVHASMRSDKDSVVPSTSADQLAAMFPNVPERYIIRAHNHIGQTRLWDQHVIVTIGSVGLPLDGNPTAQYLLLEQNADSWHTLHQSVPYDQEATLRRFKETGYLAATGPIGRLFMREVATASSQLVPFLRTYRRWSAEGDLSLEEALERFLNPKD